MFTAGHLFIAKYRIDMSPRPYASTLSGIYRISTGGFGALLLIDYSFWFMKK